EHQANVVGAFVADVLEQRQLLGQQQFGDLFHEARLLHAVGDLLDDDQVNAAAGLLDFPAGAQAERAAAGSVAVGDRGRRFNEDAAGGEVRALDELSQVFGRSLWIDVDKVQRGV